jgi:hypothetical protein
MGINYSIDAEGRIVRLSYVGEATLEEFQATMIAIFRSTLYRPGFGFLSDRRDSPPATTAYLEGGVAFIELHQEKLIGARWATVVSSPVNFGLSRMAQNLLEAKERFPTLEVFTDIHQAELWLRKTDRKD